MAFITAHKRFPLMPIEMDDISLIAVTAFTTFCFILVAYYSLHPIDPQIISSPLHFIASLPEDEIQKQPYQPDCFPGARDVETEVSCLCYTP